MIIINLLLFSFYVADSAANPYQCVDRKNATVLNELKIEFCLLKNEDTDNESVWVRLIRENISENTIILHARKNSNHRLLFSLEQNKSTVFESWPAFHFHASQPYKDAEFSTIVLKSGYKFVDDVFFADIKGGFKSTFDYNASIRFTADLELTYSRPGEMASPLESERTRRNEMRSLYMARPNPIIYESIRISR